jgi:hypothetical protein
MSETKRTRQHRYWLLRPDASAPCAAWNQAWVGYAPQTRTERRFLCVGCFEARIGRRLAAKDFRPVLVNDPNDPQMTLRGGSTSARPHALVYRCPLQQ